MQALETSGWLVGVVCLTSLVGFLVPAVQLLGIRPRTWVGLWGVGFGPLLHGNLQHLLANMLPLYLLLVLLFWDKHYHPDRTLAVIWLVGGLGTWAIGRAGSVHLGASSVVFGLVTYLVAAGFLMRSWRSAFMALLVFVFYGGVLYGVLPQRGPVSWEGHLCGALAGLGAAYFQHT